MTKKISNHKNKTSFTGQPGLTDLHVGQLEEETLWKRLRKEVCVRDKKGP